MRTASQPSFRIFTAGVSYNIVAMYGGDVDHSPSSSPAVSISGTPTLFSLGVNPSSVTMATSQNATVTVNLTSNGSFADTIGLGCASLPAGVFCHFSSPSVEAHGQIARPAFSSPLTPTIR